MPLIIVFLIVSSMQAQELDLSAYFQDYSGAMVIFNEKSGEIFRYNPEQCARRFPPCSTFKIPNSAIGMEVGVLTGPDHLFKWDGKKRFYDAWNKDLTLAEAISVSAVWYYQKLAKQVGRDRMSEYVNRFKYGNRDISGDITTFWLGSPLEITANEQIEFLYSLFNNHFNLKQSTLVNLKSIMRQKETATGTLYGKTGSNMTDNGDWVLGWFVGFVDVNTTRYYFASNITGGEKPMGTLAKKITIQVLEDMGLLGDAGAVPKINLNYTPLPNGFYRVNEMRDEHTRFHPLTGSERLQSRDYGSANGQNSAFEYFTIREDNYIPIKIKNTPVLSKDQNGKPTLGIELDPMYVKPLETFTRENIGNQVAIYIDGRVITKHTIREAIKDGKIQISQCADNVCERIFVSLTKK